MASVTLKTTGVEDTFIDSSAATTTNGSNTALYSGEFISATANTRLLIKFPLSSIPSGSTINTATLRLYRTADFSSNTRDFHVRRLLQTVVYSQATWNVYSTGNNWGTAGASATGTDIELATIGTTSIAHNVGTGAWSEWSLTASEVQEMLDGGGFTNNGFFIAPDTQTDDCWEFASTDNGTSANHPELVIDYTPPAGVNGMPVFF